MSEPSVAVPGDHTLSRTRTLILARDEVTQVLLEQQLAETQHDHVEIRNLEEGGEDPAIAAEEAISVIEPEIVVFVGWGVARDLSAVGDVVIADRVSVIGSTFGRINKRRPLTRRADPDVLRRATSLIALRRQLPRGDDERISTGDLRIGAIVAGSHALERWKDSQAADFWQDFPEALALDLGGWDFLFGYYDLVELPAIAIVGLTLANEMLSLEARRRAAEVAAQLVTMVPPDRPTAEAIAAAADDGERDHLQNDVTGLLHESTQGILQRPFVDSARAAQLRRPGATTSGNTKDQLDSAVINGWVVDEVVGHPDLMLTVRLRDDTLEYELHGGEYFQKPVGQVRLGSRLEGDPSAFRDNIMKQIREISEQPETAQLKDLEKLGNRLYRALIPEPLKREYRKFTNKESIQTLLVVSEDAWIPWELVKPYDPDDPDFKEDFMCVRFAMTRWLRGDDPKKRFDVQSVVSLEAGSVAGMDLLETAKAECEYLRSLARSRSVASLESDCRGYAHVQKLLHEDTDVHLWHIAAHGRLDQSDPEQSQIIFEDHPWVPGDLINETSIRRVRPLVFLNACLVAQQEFVLGELRGWPSAWIVDAKCGAFIAPQWSVDADLATEFSKAFFDSVVGDETAGTGKTLAEAVRAARCALRQKQPANPTWLSYVVYGHPNARIRFQSPAVDDG